jgi:hypothetical protein
MSYTLVQDVNGPGSSVSGKVVYAGTGEAKVKGEVIADGATDQQVEIAFPVLSGLQLQYILSSQNLTLYVNDTSGGAPNATIALKAGEAHIVTNGGYFANPITADVTVMYASNASGGNATLDIIALYDATP